MTELDDQALLAAYARHASEAAFATLVARHVALVHSTAWRCTHNPHHAQEIAQAVFILLARKAGSLGRGVVLSGWLYQTTRLTAANFVRREIHRQQREQEAYMQSTLNEPAAAAWELVAPLLDEAMGRLGETDRNALVLRYFENKSAREIAASLKLNEATAHKRVSRALDKLRKFFVRRGLALSATVIAGAVSAHSVQAAPAGLAQTISTVAFAKGAAAGGSTLALANGALKLMAWIKVKTTLITTVVVIVAATAVERPAWFGLGHRHSSVTSITMEKANQNPQIFTGGLNRAEAFPHTLYTYTAGDKTTRQWVEMIVKRFRPDLDPATDIKSDHEVTDEDLQSRPMVIYGSPEDNLLLRRLRDQLPIVFEEDGVVVGDKKCLGSDVGAIFACPNPLNPKNLVVIYATVSPEALKEMNNIFHGPTDYLVFNNTTRRHPNVNEADRFLLLGSFDKSDPANWRVTDKLQLHPPALLAKATTTVVVAR